MPKKKKQFKDYQDYLNSPEWKKLKNEFHEKYDGLPSVCQVTLEPIDKVELHHWNYPKDWNNDSIENLILVSRLAHQFIHDKYDKQKFYSKQEAIQCYQIEWFSTKNMNEDLARYEKTRTIEGKVIKTICDMNKVVCELIYDGLLRLTADVGMKKNQDGYFSDNLSLYINGIKLPKANSQYIIGELRQVYTSREKYGFEYDVNFKYKGINNG